MNLNSEPIVHSPHPFTPKNSAPPKPNSPGPALTIYFLFFLNHNRSPLAPPQQNAPIVTTRSKIHKGMNHPNAITTPERTVFHPYLYSLETHSLEKSKSRNLKLDIIPPPFHSTRPATYTGTSTITRKSPPKKEQHTRGCELTHKTHVFTW
jgi:hypothetical protein